MKRDEMLEIVSELLAVLYGKNVTLMEAESIAYIFNERVKKEIVALSHVSFGRMVSRN